MSQLLALVVIVTLVVFGVWLIFNGDRLLAVERKRLDIPEPDTKEEPRPRTLLGWLLGSDEAALNLIRKLGIEPFLSACLRGLDRTLRRWPWLYRKLGG
jgi:hypothetical protein